MWWMICSAYVSLWKSLASTHVFTGTVAVLCAPNLLVGSPSTEKGTVELSSQTSGWTICNDGSECPFASERSLWHFWNMKSQQRLASVLVLTGIGWFFSIVACMVLCFGFVMNGIAPLMRCNYGRYIPSDTPVSPLHFCLNSFNLKEHCH